MIKLLFSYIKHQSLQFKILLGITGLMFILLTGYAIKLSYANYLLVKFQKEKITELESQLTISEENTKKIISRGKKKTNSINNSQIEIDKKLKQDEKTIDNDSISDDDIREFLTKHQKR